MIGFLIIIKEIEMEGGVLTDERKKQLEEHFIGLIMDCDPKEKKRLLEFYGVVENKGGVLMIKKQVPNIIIVKDEPRAVVHNFVFRCM